MKRIFEEMRILTIRVCYLIGANTAAIVIGLIVLAVVSLVI